MVRSGSRSARASRRLHLTEGPPLASLAPLRAGCLLAAPFGLSAMCFLRTSQCFGWHGSKIRLLPFPGVAELSTHHGTNSLADFRELSFRDVANHPANDAATGRDQPMRQKETLLRQSTREKIRFVDRYRVFMRQGLAGDLAEQHIPAVQHSQNKSGTNLLATEIRKWERHSHRIACYKSFHASSSSAEVQSEAHAV